MEEEKINEQDYTRLIAAQNESERRIRIVGIERNIQHQRTDMVRDFIASGTFFVGALVATYFSGMTDVPTDQMVQLEIQSLNNIDALKEYLSMVTPAMWLTLVPAVSSFIHGIRNRRRLNESQDELEAINNNTPESMLNSVDEQVRIK